jgi:hypothetical protein
MNIRQGPEVVQRQHSTRREVRNSRKLPETLDVLCAAVLGVGGRDVHTYSTVHMYTYTRNLV